MRRIFVSYSRKDVGFVRRLAGDLRNAGHEVWWDVSDIRGGDDWVRVIPEAIDACECFIVVLTPHSIVSEWVRREYTQALHHHKKVVPLMLVNSTVPFSLNTLNYIDFTEDGKYIVSFTALLRALEESSDPLIVPVTSFSSLPAGYALLVTLVVFLLLVGVAIFALGHPLPSPAIFLPERTATGTSPPPPTERATGPPPSVIPQTAIPVPTYTSSSTRTPAFQRLTFCVNSRSVNSINVRSGPGTAYARIGRPLPVGSCLDFHGQSEEGTWLLIASAQDDPAFRPYEGGWIARELLGLGTDGLIDLPVLTLTPIPTSTP